MKITDNRLKEKVKFEDLSIGDFFESDAEIMMKISNSTSPERKNIYDFTNNSTDYWINSAQEVTKLNVELSIIG